MTSQNIDNREIDNLRIKEPSVTVNTLNSLTTTPPNIRSKMDQISLEFLLNKKVYKKLIGTNSLQTERENDERKEYIIKYHSEILTLFTKMLDDRDNVNVSQEIHGIFDSFIDKCVSYFIRTQKMLEQSATTNNEEDDEDEDEKKPKKTHTFAAFNKHIYGMSAMFPSQKKHNPSNFGDDITFD